VRSDLTPLYTGGDLMEQAVESHGKRFEVIWLWLLRELGIKARKMRGFYSNLWVLERERFIEFLCLIRRVFNILESAPDEIRYLLESDANYRSGNLSPTILLERTGFSYYTYYPFILERIICLMNAV
jgi:hypothetical protein